MVPTRVKVLTASLAEILQWRSDTNVLMILSRLVPGSAGWRSGQVRPVWLAGVTFCRHLVERDLLRIRVGGAGAEGDGTISESRGDAATVSGV